VLQSQGVKVYSVPMDSGGMKMDALEDLLERLDASDELPRVKLIYTVDYFQNPTGLTLAADRRPKLVEIARKFSRSHRILILEDAAYRELRYEGDDLPSVKKFDPTNEYVIYTSTFSKPCAPGLKTGYAILPRELVSTLCHLKGNHDFGSSNLAQHILSRLIESGAYARHVQTLRGVYWLKANAMLRSLEKEFADWPEVRWTHPRGGLYVWLSFPPEFDAGDKGPLVDRALAEGVLYVPGEFGHVPDEFGNIPKNEVRLSFGVSSPEQVTEGIRRLRKACRGLEKSENRSAKKVAMAV
jgi:2-aminoadipate transaminase